MTDSRDTLRERLREKIADWRKHADAIDDGTGVTECSRTASNMRQRTDELASLLSEPPAAAPERVEVEAALREALLNLPRSPSAAVRDAERLTCGHLKVERYEAVRADSGTELGDYVEYGCHACARESALVRAAVDRTVEAIKNKLAVMPPMDLISDRAWANGYVGGRNDAARDVAAVDRESLCEGKR